LTIFQNLSTKLSFLNYVGPSILSEKPDKTNFGLDNFQYGYSIGGRYYYKMKEKILSGDQGNNLSGEYFFGEFLHEGETASSKTRGLVMFGIGRQAEITGKLYMDINMGIGPKVYGNLNAAVVDIDIDFAIGYMF